MLPERERFSPGEMAVVLSHYELGVIESARELARGSRHSPKILIKTASGRFLLKRRAAGRDRPERVAFQHQLLRHLRQHRFPVPGLMTTRDQQDSLLVHEGRIYELFEFVDGERYDGSLDQTEHAGKTLARFHRAVNEMDSAWLPPAASFHDSQHVRDGLNAIPTTSASHDSVMGHEAELLSLTQELYERYDQAGEAANQLGFADWSPTIVHGDWHPGNMLFHNGRVCAVLDFDSARLSPKVVDVSNGMLQFSILRGAAEPDAWPEFFDQARMRRFLLGYLLRGALREAERRVIPHLMVESLIAECVFPIVATGSFGHLPGFGVLQMVRRKVRWLLENRERMWKWLRE